ncbi:uncharacterized protein SCHCODRAFT_02061234 [Schizophyllum commune H4-8]|uniref:uncharacterized protein n=1 Tax=Schizophyllum commune (strain H4-8 / FGSC 9210) TaxID=578458 RepID=UPI0021602118|nr:uncharacterized protein SCHCODRAFT_02061234 [Schizophyllum commune H4-8]KAI5888726.1 hypothetical protein SCHCODRAFT_02061234 [Schizophyllum commune H4-8]
MGLSNPIVHTRKGKASASATTSICTPSHIATGRLSSSANTAQDSTAVGSQNVPATDDQQQSQATRQEPPTHFRGGGCARRSA